MIGATFGGGEWSMVKKMAAAGSHAVVILIALVAEQQLEVATAPVTWAPGYITVLLLVLIHFR